MATSGMCSLMRTQDRDNSLLAQQHQVLLVTGTQHIAAQPRCKMRNRRETVLANNLVLLWSQHLL